MHFALLVLLFHPDKLLEYGSMSPSRRPGHHAPMPSLSSSISSCSSTGSSVLGTDVNGSSRRRYRQQQQQPTTTGCVRRQQRRVSFNEQVVVLGDPRQQKKSCTLSTALLDAEHYGALTTTPHYHTNYAGDTIIGTATATATAAAGTNRVSSDDKDYNWWSDESPLAVDLAEDDAMLEKEARKSRPWYRRKGKWWKALRNLHHCQCCCRRQQHTQQIDASITPSSNHDSADTFSEKNNNHATSPTSSCIPSRPFRRISAACKRVINTIVI